MARPYGCGLMGPWHVGVSSGQPGLPQRRPLLPFLWLPLCEQEWVAQKSLREKGVSVAMVFFCLSSIFRTAMVSG